MEILMTRLGHRMLSAFLILLIDPPAGQRAAEYPYVTGAIASDVSARDVAKILEHCEGKSLEPWIIEVHSITSDGFGEHLSSPPPLELPFQINGEFTDGELLNLIEYVRYKASLI